MDYHRLVFLLLSQWITRVSLSDCDYSVLKGYYADLEQSTAYIVSVLAAYGEDLDEQIENCQTFCCEHGKEVTCFMNDIKMVGMTLHDLLALCRLLLD